MTVGVGSVNWVKSVPPRDAAKETDGVHELAVTFTNAGTDLSPVESVATTWS